MAAPIYFNADQVQRVLTWPLVNAAVEQAMRAVSTDKEEAEGPYAIQPQRTITRCGKTDKAGLLFTMPGFVGNYQATEGLVNTLACKLVTYSPGNEGRVPPLPQILAHVLLLNSETGQLDAIMEATQITGWRTAAASIVATRQLYFERFAGTETASTRSIKLAIIGCGVQGRSHALGMCATYNVSAVQLWNRTSKKALALAAELREVAGTTTRIEVADTPAAAVADADIICVGTYAPDALITAEMLPQTRPLHINTVGAGKVHYGEVAQDIYDRATVYVDSMPSAKVELATLKAQIVGEVGAVINGVLPVPPQDGITIFQSMGMAAEDVTVAQAIYDKLKLGGG